MDRTKLPFRINCEGYFLNDNKQILAKLNEKGFVIFPGGGIDDSEPIEEGMKRETLEETGAIIEDLKEVGSEKFIWGKDWAQTPKQKKRYEIYQGDEMHFFIGKVIGFKESSLEEDTWGSQKFMNLDEVIKLIKGRLENDHENNYVHMQLEFLMKINNYK